MLRSTNVAGTRRITSNGIATVTAIFVIGCGEALATVLQTRLMEVAGDGQALASALNQSAFNLVNAIGPLCAGMAIGAGSGWASCGWFESILSLCGFGIWVIAWIDHRRTAKPPM